MKTIALILFAGLVVGCGSFHLPPITPDQTVAFAGDAGVGCAVIPLVAPNTVVKAREAVACVSVVANRDTVDLTKVAACASMLGVPTEYAGLLGGVIARVRYRFGSLLPPGSTGIEALRAFVGTCSLALG